MALAFLSRGISAEGSEFLIQPREQFVRAGSGVEFRVEPGAGRLGFQWERDGILIPGATNSTLTLTNVQVLDEGSYTATIGTAAGNVKAGPAALTVCRPSGFFSVRTNLPPLEPVPPTITDSLGNVYSKGFATNSNALTRRTNNFTVTKSDSEGNLLWTSGPADPAQGITPSAWAVDHENNLCVAGGRFPLTVAKFTPEGETLWSVEAHDHLAGSIPNAYSLLIDGANNILVTISAGHFESFSTTFSTFQLSPTGQRNWTIWPPVYAYHAVTRRPVFAVDPDSNFYIFGYVLPPFFYPTNVQDLILAKYDNLGRGLWTNMTPVTAAGFSTNQVTIRIEPALMKFENDQIKVLGTHSGDDGGQIFELSYRLNAVSGLPVVFQTPDEHRSWDNERLLLEAGVEGAQPMSFQWLKSGVPVPGETNRNLIFSNTQATDSGTYALFASNTLGCTISEDIPVTITRLVRPRLEAPSGPVRLPNGWNVLLIRAVGEPGTYCYVEPSDNNLHDWYSTGGLSSTFQIGPDGYGSTTYILGDGAKRSQFFRVKILP